MHRSSALRLLCVALALTCSVQAQTSRITLLQLNDVYQISPVDGGKNAGLARVETLRKQVVKESPNTLFLLAGDTISPSVASSVFRGAQMIAVWNALGLDYAVLGNHEFDFGNEVLIERMKESKFGWLGSNVIDRTTGKPFNRMPPFVIRTVGGVKVGILGLLTTDTLTSSKPGANIRIVDAVATVRRLVPQMRRRGANIIIAVTHLRMSEDKELARTGLIDIILGGHEHEVLQSQAGRTPIFKWGADARLLGRIDLNLRGRRIESIDWTGLPVTNATKDDPDAAAVVAGYEAKLSAELDKPVGRTTEPLDALSTSNRTRETNTGNLIADAYRAQLKADASLVNGGSVRANATLPAGQLTKRDLLTLLPFENPVVKIEVTGATLRAALENGVSLTAEESESGRFPQVSGLAFEYDPRRPAGSRITRVTINGAPLDEGKTYTLALSAFLLHGGDNYKMFEGAKPLIDEESAEIDSTVLTTYLSVVGAVAPKVEGRIKRLN